MKVSDIEKNGTCALCLKDGLLRNSHVISEFLYSGMYDDKHRFHVVEAGERYPCFEQKAYRERLLCQTCETKLSRWETYARDVLVGGLALQYRREANITWVYGIDYELFKLFQLSILWRAGVAKGALFRKVALGPHAERIHKMLFASDPGEPWQYGCLTVGIYRKGDLVPLIMQPTPLRILDAQGVRFTFAGYFWAYRIAAHRPRQLGFAEGVLQRSGRLALKFENLEGAGFYRDFLRNHVAKIGTM